MTRNEIKRRWPNASAAFLARNAADPLPDPQLQRDLRPPAKIQNAGKKESPSRPKIRVRITSCRSRFVDPDNLFVKYLVDALRYEGLIPNDSSSDIILELHQQKVFLVDAEMTIVELSRP
jgi:hypothetical protein